jgi:hypothetical protein
MTPYAIGQRVTARDGEVLKVALTEGYGDQALATTDGGMISSEPTYWCPHSSAQRVNAGRNLDSNRRLKSGHPQRFDSPLSTSSRLPRSR